MNPKTDTPALLHHPQWDWQLDLSLAPTPTTLPLNWDAVFAEMTALESGELVNESEQRQVGHFWLRAPELAPTMGQAAAIGETTAKVTDWVRAVRDGEVLIEGANPVTDVIHIGMGGSSLGPQLLVSALGTPDGISVHFLDNLDAHSVQILLADLRDRMESTLILVLSKSGGTVETRLLTDAVFQKFRKAGHRPEARAVAITQPASPLSARASKENWLIQFPVWDWVCGRFSTTSAVGILSAGLAGANIADILLGAREMDQWTRQEDPDQNPAARLAALWHTLGRGRGQRDLVVLPYADRLQALGRALQQICMESLGKSQNRSGAPVEQGLTVFGTKGTSDQHALMQQIVAGRDHSIVFLVNVIHDEVGQEQSALALGDTLQHFLLGTRRALKEKGRPVITWTLPKIDGVTLGATVALFERAVSFYATLIDVNAYDQPGVEAGKKGAKFYGTLQDAILSALSGRSLALRTLAERVNADPTEVQYLLGRLVATQRVSRTTEGAQSLYRRTP